jgi:outer membrane lipoprotein-sorting protein
MNTHEKIKELLTDYALRELAQQKSSEVKQHLADCQECRTELKKLEAVLQCADSMSKLSADEQVIESAKESLLKAVADEEQKEPTSRPTIRLDFIWSTIMKSRMTKLAAAAVIIIAILAGLPLINNGGSGDALAKVLDTLEQTRAYMYTMEMKTTGKLIPFAQESKIIATHSDDYGIKWYWENTDPNTGKITTQKVYLLPEKKMAITIMPETKQYIRMPFGDEMLIRMKQQNNDPSEMIRQIMKCEYTELDRTVIDGVEVQGFRTTDPDYKSALGSDATSIELTLWVDVETWLPVLMEMDINSGEQMQVTGSTYDYRWNVPVQASDFEPNIPEDFKPFAIDGLKMPGMTETDAIEGLRLFAEMTGRYPKKLNMLDLAQEIAAFNDILMEELKKLKEEMGDTTKMTKEELRNAVMKKSMESTFLKKLMEDMGDTTEMTNEEFRNTLMKKSMETMRPLQSIGFFYMTLVADKKEPVYYGESVGPDDADLVLLKWKVSDDHYRVIFGDLTAEDLTVDQWNELQR